MKITRNDRVLSVITPLLIILSIAITPWIAIILPAILYLFYKKFQFHFSQINTLRIFDLTVSLIILTAIFGFLNSALFSVAQDRGFIIPIVSSGLSKYILAVSIFGYYIIYLVIFTASALSGKEVSPYLSFKIFESFKDKRAVDL